MKYQVHTLLFLFATICGLHAQELKQNQKAPEICLNNLNNEELKLSSLRGKIVLIDFWASWCAPCRKENPNIVAAYQKYKDASFNEGEGFTVFSVSLDKSIAAWQNAVDKDHLEWPYHVSDLQGWNNAAAQLYNIKAVPSNYLIDGEGKIIAINLRGEALDAKLKKLQKQPSFWEKIWK